MACTRSSDIIYMLGYRDLKPITQMNQLPTWRQVLVRFHQHLYSFKLLRSALHCTAEELCNLWSNAGLPCRTKKLVIKMLDKCHAEWLLIKKNRNKLTECQKSKEANFIAKLDTLCCICDMAKVTCERHLEFITDQSEKRKLTFSSVGFSEGFEEQIVPEPKDEHKGMFYFWL